MCLSRNPNPKTLTAMLSSPQSRQLASPVAKKTPSLDGKHSHQSCVSRTDSAPTIAVTRPSLVSALVDANDLSLLRVKYEEERYNEQNRNRSSSLSVGSFHQISRSAQSSPKLQRRASFRVKRQNKSSSNGMNQNGYEPLNPDFASEANQFSLERVTSVQRVLSRNNSFTSTPSSPRPYRAKMNLVPAKHRVVHSDSSDDEDFTSGLVSPESESNLDFGSGARNLSSHVS